VALTEIEALLTARRVTNERVVPRRVPGGLVEPSGDARNDYLPRANKHTPSCAFRPLPSHFQTPIR